MELLVKRIDKTLPLPEYQTAGSVGFDLYARIAVEIKPREIAIVPANLVVKVPSGYMLALISRSSTPRKKGLLKPHAIGVIDQDYCGENDELGIQVYNFTDQTVIVDRGERIAQAVVIPVQKVEFSEVENMNTIDRGGFGSTG
jgi:dUTP pyrophosphatase